MRLIVVLVLLLAPACFINRIGTANLPQASDAEIRAEYVSAQQCQALSYSRDVRREIVKRSEWSEQTKRDILGNSIREGFTIWQVDLAFGTPFRIHSQTRVAGMSLETREYSNYFLVYFTNGKCSGWTKMRLSTAGATRVY